MKTSKNFIVTKSQLNEYVENKKSKKIFDSIISDFDRNRKSLKENMSLMKANNLTLEKYKRENKLNSRVLDLLKEYSIVNDKGEILQIFKKN